MNEEKYGYDDVEETEVLEVFDPSNIVPVAPPVAMAPEVLTEPETEVLTEVEVEQPTEVSTEAVVEANDPQMDGVDGTVQLNEVEINNGQQQISNVRLFFTFLLMLILGGTIIFMPEINEFIRMKQAEDASMLQPKITTGSLKC